MRLLSWTRSGWQEYVEWQQQDRKTLKRINRLLEDITRHPQSGLGKPEPLTGQGYEGLWSRRIDEKNRIVYRIEPDRIIILECRSHYRDH